MIRDTYKLASTYLQFLFAEINQFPFKKTQNKSVIKTKTHNKQMWTVHRTILPTNHARGPLIRIEIDDSCHDVINIIATNNHKIEVKLNKRHIAIEKLCRKPTETE